MEKVMKNKRIFKYDFIRVTGMMVILIFHFNVSLAAHNIPGKMLFGIYNANGSYADIGVPLFFILSGATLMQSAQKDFKSFYKKRFSAIFPLFWLAYFIILIYYFLKYKSIHPFVAQPEHWTALLTMIGMDGYFAGVFPTFYLLGEWFLGCLLFMYLLFTLLQTGVKKYPRITAFLVMAVYFIVIHKYVFLENKFQNIWVRLPEFVFGMYLTEYCIKVKKSACLIVLFITGMLLFVPFSDDFLIYIVTVRGMTCYFMCDILGEQLERKLCWWQKNIFEWLSKYSFAIYLLHHVISEQIISNYDSIALSTIELGLLFMIVMIADFSAGWLLVKLESCVRKKLCFVIRPEKTAV